MSKRIEIYLSDFRETMQQDLLEAHKVSSPEGMSWNVFPLKKK